MELNNADRGLRDSLLLLSNFLCKLTGDQLLCNHFYSSFEDKSSYSCISTFWNVLHKLTCREVEACNQCLVNCVKAEFALLGYPSADFFSLPQNKTYGSQHLLFALSWLIASGFLEALIDGKFCNSPIAQEFPPETYVELSDEDLADEFEENCDNILNYLEMCAVLLKHKSLSVDDLQNRRYRELLAKVHGITRISKLSPRLTVNELVTFHNNGSSANEYLNHLYELCDLAESHMLWIKKKDIFLKWIKRALTERVEKGISGNEKSANLEIFLLSLPELMKRKMNHVRWSPTRTLHEKLTEMTSHIPTTPHHAIYHHRLNELMNILRERDGLLMIHVPRRT